MTNNSNAIQKMSCDINKHFFIFGELIPESWQNPTALNDSKKLTDVSKLYKKIVVLSQTRCRGKALGKRHFFVERRDYLWVITALAKTGVE